MDNHFQQIFDGLLISDGYIEKHRECRNSCFGYDCKHIRYIEYIKYLFEEQHFVFYANCPYTRTYVQFPQSVSYSIKTKVDTYFTEQRERWYPQGKKIIPRDFHISPTVVSLWICGDGCLSYKWGKKKASLALYTNCFSLEDRTFIQSQFLDLGIKSNFDKRSVMNFGVHDTPKIFEYCGLSPCDCYNYKWVFSDYDRYKYVKNDVTCSCIRDNQQLKLLREAKFNDYPLVGVHEKPMLVEGENIALLKVPD